MNEISCEVCRDLMPLVKDGIASEESRAAVMGHLERCDACRKLFGTERTASEPQESVLSRVMHRMRLFLAMLLMFGILFGLSLTAGSSIFYNVVLMPAIGAVGYYLFRWKALYILPLLLSATHAVTNLLGMGNEVLDAYSMLLWSLLYSLFAVLGTIIAWLLHFVFRKED